MSPKEMFAAFNAMMNGTSGLLLMLAYIMIRQRKIRAHVTLMIAGLCTSAIFLVSYLYSHYAYGERTSGLPPSGLRTIYLILLASHILLAVVMLPPIFITVWQGANRRWESHKRIARPTFWIWLYVSVTGVVVYWMLYHVFPSMAAPHGIDPTAMLR